MSSRHKRKGGGLRYPTPWGEWAWSDEYQRHWRSRLKGPDDWEYEYDQPEHRPRTITPFGPADLQLPPPSPYPSSSDYTAANDAEVDDITQGVSQSTLEERGPKESWRASTVTYPYAASSGSYSSAATYPSSSTAYPPSSGAYPSSASIEDYFPSASPATGSSTPSYDQASYPSPSPASQPHLKTRDPYTDREAFDPHYKVHGTWAFKFGKIFKVLWAEPKGEGGGSAGKSGTQSWTVRKGPGGQDTYAKVRRFVIIKPMDGYCICLPILTYSGKGVNKSGVHASHHTIIYSGKKPIAFRGEKEKGLTMRSIKVAPDNPRHKLDDASRLNYAKAYTVEYNVKVWFIGKVSSDSEWQIRTDYNRIHPPLEIKGVPAPEMPDNTYRSSAVATNYAIGGGSAAYPESSTSYGSSYSMGSQNAVYHDSGSDTRKTSNDDPLPYDDPAPSSGSSYPSQTLYGTSGSSYDRRGYYTGGYKPQDPVNRMDHGGYSSNGYAEHSSQRKKGKYQGEPGYSVVGENGDPLHDGDSDDNGDQGDQDRGGGQKCERYSRNSRRRR